jgi:hypothetical protein
MDTTGKSVSLLVIISVIAVITAGWIQTNYEPQRTGNILLGLSIAALVFVAVAELFKDTANIDDNSAGPEISGRQLGVQAIVGVLLSIIPIVLSIITPFSIGLPSVNLSVVGQSIIRILIAPIVEEVFFLGTAIMVYYVALLLTKQRFAAIPITLVMVSATFSLYHWLAYGATFLVSGAFVGAAVFRFLTLLIVLAACFFADEESGFSVSSVAPVIITTIVMHMAFNAFITIRSLSVVGVA